jgi:hypothetical protein
LVSASLSSSSWSRHAAAVSSLTRFLIHKNLALSWPLEISIVRGYISWALTIRKLSPETVKVYLSDLKMAHKIRNLEAKFENDFFNNAVLKGAKNISLYSAISRRSRFKMSFPLLKLLGHEIAISNWSQDSKFVFWTACCVAFFGSFCLGEILPKSDEHESETLTWNQVKFTKNNLVVVNIKFRKVIRSSSGDFVDLFEIKNSSFCPFAALKTLASRRTGSTNFNRPVFQFANGKNLTQKIFTTTVVSLLERHVGSGAKKFSGHSFRAAIPSALANTPDLASDSDIMMWGRWSSESYKSCTRLKHNARKATFEKIVSMYSL